MTSPSLSRPSLLRCAGAALMSGLCLAFLVQVPLPWPPGRPDALADWWMSAGAAHGAVAIVRVGGVAIGAWLLVTSLGGALVATTGRCQAHWRRLTPGPLRRALIGAAVSAATLSAPPAGADEPPPPVLHDLGPVEAEQGPAVASMVLRDLGPIEPADPADHSRAHAQIDPGPATWVVARGDHLWAVAEATLADHGLDTDDATTAAYWRELIEANRATIGEDPDLIHPGDVLVLPPMAADPSLRAGS